MTVYQYPIVDSLFPCHFQDLIRDIKQLIEPVIINGKTIATPIAIPIAMVLPIFNIPLKYPIILISQ